MIRLKVEAYYKLQSGEELDENFWETIFLATKKELDFLMRLKK